jgi:hypothetical protein
LPVGGLRIDEPSILEMVADAGNGASATPPSASDWRGYRASFEHASWFGASRMMA